MTMTSYSSRGEVEPAVQHAPELEARVPRLARRQMEFGAVEQGRGAHQVDVGPVGRADRVLEVVLVAGEQRHGRVLGLDLRVGQHAEQRGGRALGIQVDQQHLVAAHGQALGQGDGRGRLGDAALEVGDGDGDAGGAFGTQVLGAQLARPALRLGHRPFAAVAMDLAGRAGRRASAGRRSSTCRRRTARPVAPPSASAQTWWRWAPASPRGCGPSCRRSCAPGARCPRGSVDGWFA